MSGSNFVSADRFLYSCLEYEEYVSSLTHGSKKRISWPVLVEDDHALEEGDFNPLLKQLFEWYAATYQDLSMEDILDTKVINNVVPPLVSLLKDTAYLFSYKHNCEFPLYNFAGNNDQVWNDLSQLVEEFFPNNSNLFQKYFHWTYARNKEDDRNGLDQPQSQHFNNKINGNIQDNYNGNTRSNNKFRGRSNNNRDGNFGNHQNGKRPFNGKNGNGFRQQQRYDKKPFFNKENKELESKAISECKEACEKLKQDDNLTEIMLNPQNSFYRRIQHNEVAFLGFKSESTGEGKTRCVVISRK